MILQFLRTNYFAKMSIFKALNKFTFGVHQETLLRIYRILIRPHLDYGCQLHQHTNNSILHMLDVIHHSCHPLTTDAFHNTSA